MDSSASLRGCFVTGTDTDAGKTTVVAALLRAIAGTGTAAAAVKPVQTGCSRKNGQWIAPDALCYAEAMSPATKSGPEPRTLVLRCFEPACSPHLAASRAGIQLDASRLAAETRGAVQDGAFTLVEGAGGMLAPLNERQSMLDLMLALDLPVLLAVPNRLGCINQAMLSMRLLAQTPLQAAGLVLCRTAAGDEEIMRENSRFIARHGEEFGFPLLCELPYLPELNSQVRGDRERAWQKLAEILGPCTKKLLSATSASTVADVREADRRCIWHPYAGTEPAPRTYEAVGAAGTRIFLADGRELLDGMSSWWCANLGYGRSDLQQALATQARRLPHIMFGGFTHAPAVNLAKKLLSIAPAGFERVFFADSGSVAVEVALKMAIQYQLAAGNLSKTRICAFRGAYHGDTLGAMSVCDPVNGMHHIFGACLPGQLFLDRPGSPFGQKPDNASLEYMENVLREHAGELAAVIVEPIVQGAGGMWFYHPDYLVRLRELCDELEILLIADEIATGFGRTGKLFACEWAGIAPDIMCLGKALTGGMMTFSAVLASGRVARTISQPGNPGQPGILLHGPTFMANPLACAVALQAVETLLASPWQENVARIEKRLAAGLAECRGLPGVRDVRVLGAIGVVETEKPVDTEKLQKFFVDAGVWIRPFNRLIYVMPPFIASDDEIDRLTDAICMACKQNMHQ